MFLLFRLSRFAKASVLLGGALTRFRAKIAAVAASVFLSSLTGSLAQPAGKLSITVTGARNSDGVVRCALFNSPAAFPKIGQEWRGVIAPIRGGAANCVFSGANFSAAAFRCDGGNQMLQGSLSY
jgi:uncharacterized protein (DUF2141 family)